MSLLLSSHPASIHCPSFSTCLSVHPFIHPSSIHPPTSPSTHASIHPHTHLFIILLPTHLPTYVCIYPYTCLPIYYTPIYNSICPSIPPSLPPSIHPPIFPPSHPPPSTCIRQVQTGLTLHMMSFNDGSTLHCLALLSLLSGQQQEQIEFFS